MSELKPQGISDAEIAGIMGWRGPGAYTESSLRKIKQILEADRARRAPVSTPQQSAQRASVDTLSAIADSIECDGLVRTAAKLREEIAHINAWGSAGSGATSEAVSVMLWLYRRLPRTYGRPPHVEQPIIALAKAAGIDMKDVTESFAERGAAPSPAPQGEQA